MRLKAQSLSRLWPVLFFSLLTLILFAPIRSSFNYYDEGFAVTNATRLLDHQAPYRDFWSIYPPGQLYILAGIFKLFGVSLTVSRCYDTLVRLLLALGLFLVARTITAPRFAFLATLAAALVLAMPGFYTYAVYPAMAAGIFALYSELQFVRGNSRRWLLASGTFAGVAGIIRWDIAIYIAFGLSGALFIYEHGGRRRPRATSAASVHAPIMTAVLPLVVTATFLVAGYGLVGLRSGLGNLWDQVFRFPATQMRAVRWLAYPELLHPHIASVSDFWRTSTKAMSWLRFYLPLAAYAMAWLYYARAILMKHVVLAVPDFGIMATALSGSLLFSQALNRYDYAHVLPSLIMAALLFAALLPRILTGSGRRALKGLMCLLVPAIASVFLLTPLYGIAGTMHSHPWGRSQSGLPRAGCASTSPIDEEAVRYVQAHTAPDQPIFVGNQRHDMLYKSDVGFYYLAARRSATRYSELHPGVANTLPVQKEIAGDLEIQRVKLIVLANIDPSDEPNDSNKSTGVVYLDAYIREHYSVAAVFGKYQIWQRRP